jgi:acyl carrier protein
MTQGQIEKELRVLVSELSKQDAWAVGLDDDLTEVLDIDSLTALRVLAAAEKRFDVHFPDDQLEKLRTLRRLRDALVSLTDGVGAGS